MTTTATTSRGGAASAASPARVPPTSRVSTGSIVVTGALLAAAAATGSLLVGAQAVSPADVLSATAALARGEAGVGEVEAVTAARLGRTLFAIVIGAALALGGLTLQGLTRNPIADPGILGLQGGASLIVVLGLQAGLVGAATDYLWAALVGVLAAGLLVHAITLTAPVSRQPVTAALAGAAVMAMSASVIGAIMVTDRGTLDTFRFWQVGSVGGRDPQALATLAPFLIVGLVLVLTSARTLDAIALGDDLARGLGQRVLLHRGAAAAGALLLIAVATALAGPIGFVGLAVPHLVRLLIGPAHGRAMIGCLFGGPVLVILADTLGRVIAPPSEIQAGIVTAIIGAPVLIVIARKARRR